MQGPYPNHRPLHLSCTKGHMAVTKLLLMQEADKRPDIHLTAGKNNSILHKAVYGYNDNADFMRMLIKDIRDIYSASDLWKLLDKKSLDDKTPLMCAVEDDNRNIVDVLVDCRPNEGACCKDLSFRLLVCFGD